MPKLKTCVSNSASVPDTWRSQPTVLPLEMPSACTNNAGGSQIEKYKQRSGKKITCSFRDLAEVHYKYECWENIIQCHIVHDFIPIYRGAFLVANCC